VEGSSGYLSRARTAVFAIIKAVMISVKIQ